MGVTVRGLCVEGPGGAPLVRGVDLRVAPTEILGLVGPSGAGKSLVAAAMAGLIPPPALARAGRMDFDGQTLDMTDPRQWRGLRGRGVFLLMQSSAAALDPTMTIGRQVAEALSANGVMAPKQARDATGGLLAQVGLEPGLQRAYPHQLSGGMRQRAQLAMALGLRPRLLIADEPTTGLDPIMQAEILRLLRLMNARHGSAMMLISHDWRVIAAMAARVAVMERGAIVESGPTAQLMASPRHPATRLAMAALRELEAVRA